MRSKAAKTVSCKRRFMKATCRKATKLGMLVALGYGQSDAAVAVGQMEPGLSVDEMIRRGLRQLAANL